MSNHQDRDAPAEKPAVDFQDNMVNELDKGVAVDYSGAQNKVDPAEIKLVRKLDIWIMPILWIMYWLNFLDRNAIAYARLDGIEEELGLSDSQYATCVSILFVGYISAQLPSNIILTRVRISWYMGGFMILWAIVSTLTALANDFIGLVLTRFFLGLTEAPYYPGALYMLSIFYTRKEIATRIAVLYTGSILASSFAGLIALGIFNMEGVAGLSGWRWLFILQGLLTFVVAFASLFILPDDPTKTWWLTTEERKLAKDRIDRDTVQLQEEGSNVWEGLKQAVTDKKLWLFVCMQHLHMATNGFKNFFPSVVNTLGFSRTITLVLTCPPYLIAGIFAVCWSINSGRVNERTWHVTVGKIIATVGFITSLSTVNNGARYFAMIVFTIGSYAPTSIIFGWVSSTCCQSKEKKACSVAIVNMTANLSYVWTAYLWPSSGEPRFVTGMSSSIAMCGLTIGAAWLMKWMLVHENKRIRQRDDETTVFYAY